MVELAAMAVIWGYVIAFLALTAMTARRAGTRVWVFGVGGEPQTLPATLFRASFALGAALPPVTIWVIASGNSPWLLLPWDVAPLVAVGGLAAMIAGTGLALHAQRHMGNSWRIGAAEGHIGRIVDTGPFSFSRNPVFVGQMILFAGLWLVFPTPVQMAVTLALIVAAVLQVRIEERVLARELGQPYSDYRRRVRRWL